MIGICRSNRIGEELVSACKRAGCTRFWGKGMHAFDLTEGWETLAFHRMMGN